MILFFPNRIHTEIIILNVPGWWKCSLESRANRGEVWSGRGTEDDFYLANIIQKIHVADFAIEYMKIPVNHNVKIEGWGGGFMLFEILDGGISVFRLGYHMINGAHETILKEISFDLNWLNIYLGRMFRWLREI